MHIERRSDKHINHALFVMQDREAKSVDCRNGCVELVFAEQHEDGPTTGITLRLPASVRTLQILNEAKALALREYEKQMMQQPEVVSAIVDGLRKDMEVKDAS